VPFTIKKNKLGSLRVCLDVDIASHGIELVIITNETTLALATTEGDVLP